MAIYTGVNGVARNVKEIYIGVNGVARKVVKAYVGVDGKARLFYSSGLATSDIPVGTLIRVHGKIFRVVHQGLPSGLYDSSCNGTWLLREDVLYDHNFDATNNDYENSDIHTFLNESFLNGFDSGTKSVIKQVKIPYYKGTGGSGSVASGSSGLSTKIFLLSGYEVGWTTSDSSYFPVDGACLDYFKGTAQTDSKRIGKISGTATNWWLRSPRESTSSTVFYVNTSGKFGNKGVTLTDGVRPALVLSADAKVNPQPNSDGSYTLLV